jgi:hypothetical protein
LGSKDGIVRLEGRESLASQDAWVDWLIKSADAVVRAVDKYEVRDHNSEV